MAINLKKKDDVKSYYYSEKGTELGPFELSILLTKINANTLVWREGIEWTNAGNLEELKKFFPKEKSEPSKIVEVDSTAINNQVSGNSAKKMFNAPFSFEGRIRRMEYGISIIIYVVAYSIVIGLSNVSFVFALAWIPILWFFFAQGSKRCHDRGNSGWFQIIPFYGFWMLFAEGESNSNEYGNSPK